MSPGGDVVYYFSIHVRVDNGEAAHFDMRLNDVNICTTYPDHSDTNDYSPGLCSAVVDVIAGDM